MWLLHFFFIWYVSVFLFEFLQTLNVPSFLRRRADPKNVASIVLGGGPGTQLYPLTKRAATPAVSDSHAPNILEFCLCL